MKGTTQTDTKQQHIRPSKKKRTAYQGITEKLFHQELTMCKKLSNKHKGCCAWGKCQGCGVIPFLYKLHYGKVIDDPVDITRLKNDIIYPYAQ